MSYCCVCSRKANHSTKSFHLAIEDDIYHYCHWHGFIGKRLSNKTIKQGFDGRQDEN